MPDSPAPFLAPFKATLGRYIPLSALLPGKRGHSYYRGNRALIDSALPTTVIPAKERHPVLDTGPESRKPGRRTRRHDPGPPVGVGLVPALDATRHPGHPTIANSGPSLPPPLRHFRPHPVIPAKAGIQKTPCRPRYDSIVDRLNSPVGPTPVGAGLVPALDATRHPGHPTIANSGPSLPPPLRHFRPHPVIPAKAGIQKTPSRPRYDSIVDRLNFPVGPTPVGAGLVPALDARARAAKAIPPPLRVRVRVRVKFQESTTAPMADARKSCSSFNPVNPDSNNNRRIPSLSLLRHSRPHPVIPAKAGIQKTLCYKDPA